MEQVRDKPKGKLGALAWYVRDVAEGVARGIEQGRKVREVREYIMFLKAHIRHLERRLEQERGRAEASAGEGRRSGLLGRVDPTGNYQSDDDFARDYREQQQAIGDLLGAGGEAVAYSADYIRENLRNVRGDDAALADALERLTHAEVRIAETERERDQAIASRDRVNVDFSLLVKRWEESEEEHERMPFPVSRDVVDQFVAEDAHLSRYAEKHYQVVDRLLRRLDWWRARARAWKRLAKAGVEKTTNGGR